MRVLTRLAVVVVLLALPRISDAQQAAPQPATSTTAEVEVITSSPGIAIELAPTAASAVFQTHVSSSPSSAGPQAGTTPLAPSAVPVKISAPMVLSGDVLAAVAAANGSLVVYVADQDVDAVQEVYSVPVGGGVVTQLNPPLVAGGNVQSIAVSADSQTLVYLADQDADTVNELYSVPVAGGPVTKISGPMVLNGDVLAFTISPDSTQVSYVADQVTDTVNEVYGVPIGGGTATKLNPTPVLNGDVLAIVITRDSSRVIYRADQITDAVDELFSVPIGGGVATKLNPTPVLNGDITAHIAGSGARVFYLGDQDTDAVVEIYSVPQTGGAAVKLNGAMVVGGNVTNAFIGNARVAYLADQDVNETFEVYVSPFTGGGPLKVNPPLVLGGDVLQITIADPADQTLIYRADQDVDEVQEFYSVPTTGGGSTKLNSALVAGGDVLNYGSVATGALPQRALYFADQDTDVVVELYGVPLPSGATAKLNAALVAGGNVASVNFTASGLIAYRADQDADEVAELYSRTLTGIGPATKLNLPPVLGGDVLDQRFSGVFPFPSYVVYRADQDADEVIELYSTFLDGDADGDAVVDGLDCLATDGTQWDIPGEVTALLMSHTGGVGGTTTMTWSRPSSLGGTAVLYDTIRSSTGGDFSAAGACVETQDGSDTTSIDTFTPGPELFVGFLVRATNACGIGTSGTTSGGGPRSVRACP